MSTKARRVGGDWVESVDNSSGKVYYANMKTKETSWTMPEEVKAFQLEQSKKKNVGIPDANKDTWLERRCPKTNKIYYFNPHLKQTSWNLPDKTVLAATSDKDFGKGTWVQRIDPKSGRPYYYNHQTQVTSWTNPDEDQKKPAKPGLASRLSNRLSFQPKATDQPAYSGSNTPAAPVNTNAGRASIRLGAMAAPKAGNRVSMAGMAREKVREQKEAAGIVDQTQQDDVSTPDLQDRFAKLRALRNRANGGEEDGQQEEVQEPQIDLEDLTAEALADVNYDLKMENYVQEYFNLNRKGWGKKATTVQKILSWKTDRIRTSLHPLSDPALVHDAILAFQNILCYMGDKPSKNPISNANRIFRITVQSPEDLRDEVYCQLVKQTTNNPDATSTLRGWELLAMCAGLFPPSSKLEKYLLSYMRRTTENQPYPGVGKLAEYALLRVRKSTELGPRKEVPTDMEIESVRSITPLTIRIHMLDGAIIPMEAESWTTIKELNDQMAKHLRIKDKTPFSTYEHNNRDEERALDEDDRVLDIIAYWDREARACKRAKDVPHFQFVYKVRLFFDIKEDDETAIEVAFHQAVHDVTDSRYPCSEEDSLRLAALQAQEKFGDCDGTDVFGDELQAFLPAKYYHEDVVDDLKNAIMDTYKLLRGYDKHEAMNNYLDYVKAWKIYGSAYFFVEPQNAREFPPDVVLAINSKGVMIVDPSTQDFLAEHPYSDVVTWGHSSVTFVLVVGNLIRQNKLYFKTDEGAELNALIHAYVNKLVEE
mmetsp:Transcript_26353/g.42683  ORF Transcript_26353/g.42683 Transcript_26353/m.42683 type:complete len:764 (-) Transcript_26353:552-2843(-)